MRQIDILGINVFKNGGLSDGFYINRLSQHLQQSHHHINRPHKHDSYAIIMFTAGSGTHDIEFSSFDVEPGAIFFLAPGLTHNWNLANDCEGFVLFHSGDFFNSHFSKLNTEDFAFYSGQHWAPIVLSKENLSRIATDFEQILLEQLANAGKNQVMILSLLTRIYVLSERHIENIEARKSGKSIYQSTFSEFQKLLEKNYTDEKSASQYAKRLNISAKHLNRITKTLINKTTSELIADRIILEAKRMLLHTSLSSTEIAAELGFSDYAYFSKLFRKHVGVSPTQFVNQYSGFPIM